MMPEPGIPIESWAQDTIDNLSRLRISAVTAAQPISTHGGNPTLNGLRGTSVALDIPLDTEDGRPSEPKSRHSVANSIAKPVARVESKGSDDEEQPSSGHPRRREPSRRDSLKRREALLKGKEGSRRRQKWENDRLIGNPHVVPPEPHDWQPRATHPIRVVPYYLAPLWDDRKIRPSSQANDRLHSDNEKHAGQAVPRELRERLKRSRAAKSLLQSLEEQVRQFVKSWAEREKAVIAAKSKFTPDSTATSAGELEEEGGWTLAAPQADSESRPSTSDNAYSTESDDEIVFVGRKAMREKQAHDRERGTEEAVHTANDPPKTDKLVLDALASDPGASFERWLLHNIAAYYSLRAWSVTTADHPARREAYIGIPEERDRFAARLGLDLRSVCRGDADLAVSAHALPQPLWGMV